MKKLNFTKKAALIASLLCFSSIFMSCNPIMDLPNDGTPTVTSKYDFLKQNKNGDIEFKGEGWYYTYICYAKDKDFHTDSDFEETVAKFHYYATADGNIVEVYIADGMSFNKNPAYSGFTFDAFVEELDFHIRGGLPEGEKTNWYWGLFDGKTLGEHTELLPDHLYTNPNASE